MRLLRIAFVALACATLLLAAGSATAHAQVLPYTTQVIIGSQPPPCDTCPPSVCAGRPIPVRVEGEFPDNCWIVRRVEFVPSIITVIGPPTIRILLDDMSCVAGMVCLDSTTAWAVDTLLPPLPIGNYRLPVQIVHVSCADSFPPDSIHEARFAFRAEQSCSTGTFLPYIDQVVVGAPHCAGCPPVVCAGEPFPVTLSGILPDDCVAFRGLTLVPLMNVRAGPPIVRATFAYNDCQARPCNEVLQPWTASIELPGLPAGPYSVLIESRIVSWCDSSHVLDLQQAGVPFTVDSCPPPPPATCLRYDWAPPYDPAGCNAVFVNDTASVDLRVASPVALAALQGVLRVQPGLQVRGLHPIGPASGMSLQWLYTPTGARFVMFAPSGAPIPPFAEAPNDTDFNFQPVLRVEVLNVPYPHIPEEPPLSVFSMFADSLLGADSLARGVPMCYYRCADSAGYFPCGQPLARFCVGSACDVNFDGHRDVRDLVLQARCLVPGACFDPAKRFDCDRDSLFTLQDVICCAMAILNGSEPVSGQRAEPSVSLGFGEPVRAGDVVELPFTLEGADRVGAARVTLRFPADRYDVAGFRMVGDPPGWLALHDVQGGQVVIGLIALDATQAGPALPLALRLRLRPGAEHGGEVVTAGADVAGADGVALETSIEGVGAVLDPSSAIALSAVGPNPASSEARFTLTLPHGSTVELAVHDLAGRRIATIHRGALAAGIHPFAWDGRTDRGEAARDGVYFVRVRADGVELARKAVLLRGR